MILSLKNLQRRYCLEKMKIITILSKLQEAVKVWLGENCVILIIFKNKFQNENQWNMNSKQLLKKNKPYLNTKVEKAMAPHSSTLAWKIPWMEGPGGLQSMGSLRVRHNWVTSLSLFTFMHWRRKWQHTPVFLPGESQGPGSLVGCCLQGRTESDTTEAT